MLLVLDVGNTHVDIGLFRGDELRHRWKIASDLRQTEDEYGQKFLSLGSIFGVGMKDICDVVMASVVPGLTPILISACQRYLGRMPMVVGPGVKTGVNIKTENPKEVGPDRIAHAVAAIHKYGTPAIVVDFGTATALDVISPQGDYLGSAIAPGVRTALQSLSEQTARLPRVELLRPKRAIGRTTAESMQSGIVFGFAGMVDALVRRVSAELNLSPKVIATGDAASLMKEVSETITLIDPILALEGLRLIYGMNASSG